MRGHLDDLLLAEAEPAGDVQAAVVALLRRQDDAVAADAVVHRVGKRLLDAQAGAVERGARAAEGEDAGGAGRVVADEAGGHGGDGRLGHGEAVGRVVRHEVRVVDGGQQRPDHARDGRRRHDVDLRPRMAPDRHALEPADELARHVLHAAPLLGQRRLLRRGIVELLRPAEQRQLGLHVVDPVEGLHDREDEVGVAHAVRDRRREGVPQVGQPFVVAGLAHSYRTLSIRAVKAGSQRMTVVSGPVSLKKKGPSGVSTAAAFSRNPRL